MEDLKDILKNQDSAVNMVRVAWETSAKNGAAKNYIAGVIDALRFSGALSLEQYNKLYAQYL